MKDERLTLLKCIQEADFAAYDLQLFLDTHPHNKDALRMYKTHVERGMELKKHYIERYGPITAQDSPDHTPWKWIQSPWTWEKEASANVDL